MQVATDSERKLGMGHGQIAIYFGLGYLLYTVCIPSGGFANIPMQWVLKNRLNLSPERIAFFQLLIAAPTYVAFLFGFLRDRWSPFGKGDRGIFWIFAPLGALAYAWAATGQPTYRRLLVAAFCATVAYRFVGASLQGLTAIVGQRYSMTGLLSTIWNAVGCVLGAVSCVIGGLVSDHLTFAQIFGLLGALTLGLVILGLWSPAPVFEGADALRTAAKQRNLWREFVRIGKHRPIWPAAIIWLLWSFAPGMATPLLFYLNDELHSSAAQFGYFNAMFAISFLPMYLLYGVLCRHTRLRSLLLWGTVFAVPQMIPLLFLHNAAQAIWMAAPMGLSGGIATAAYIDLVLRSCPKGLEGTGMMVADAGYFVALRFGDLLGAWLYRQGGFHLAAWITTGVYALILPMIFLVPRAVTETHDEGEPLSGDSAELATPLPQAD